MRLARWRMASPAIRRSCSQTSLCQRQNRGKCGLHQTIGRTLERSWKACRSRVRRLPGDDKDFPTPAAPCESGAGRPLRLPAFLYEYPQVHAREQDGVQEHGRDDQRVAVVTPYTSVFTPPHTYSHAVIQERLQSHQQRQDTT